MDFRQLFCDILPELLHRSYIKLHHMPRSTPLDLQRFIGILVGSICSENPINHPISLLFFRPICLRYPINKIMIGIHYSQILKAAFNHLRTMPLFAYLPHRSIKDCLLLIFDYCRTVQALCQQHTRDIGLWGDASLVGSWKGIRCHRPWFGFSRTSSF